MHRVPVLLVGDGPQEPTGLGRILRDIGGLLRQLQQVEDLPIDLCSVGGRLLPTWGRWPHLPMELGEDWGARYVAEVWRDRWGTTPGVLFLIWDPARCYPYLETGLPVQLWAYPAIDSSNRNGTLGGPPAAALARFHRVLGYGRWGAEVIRSVRGEPVTYLPHGLDLATWAAPVTEAEQAWVTTQLGPHCTATKTLVGCVATNQARKDLSLFTEALAILRERGEPVYGWLHTDREVGAWSIAQLVEDAGLQHRVTVTLGAMSDRQLACLYQRCAVTIAPGLGEGFGYPIVESLASGVPVVHGDFAGGAELVPKTEWRVPVRERRRESCYALTRPVFRPEDVANAVERALNWRSEVGEATCAAYCRGAVAHLDWSVLGMRWATWLRGGLQ
jgi:glycosyltransferase involved in cell wall biosynthesis